ncbi:hypothetical protein IE53DRAFT_391721 [Violaceomyces palustris]|uniref:Uncharacterized protein n=1 Tax=Violaceomyces palustris TaxID=1673888 RepID=A0ACD0NLS3_9BASI|nr:hypothetical protein IE53DRAFT_391721 [Violaceomyces palustris]
MSFPQRKSKATMFSPTPNDCYPKNPVFHNPPGRDAKPSKSCLKKRINRGWIKSKVVFILVNPTEIRLFPRWQTEYHNPREDGPSNFEIINQIIPRNKEFEAISWFLGNELIWAIGFEAAQNCQLNRIATDPRQVAAYRRFKKNMISKVDDLFEGPGFTYKKGYFHPSAVDPYYCFSGGIPVHVSRLKKRASIGKSR